MKIRIINTGHANTIERIALKSGATKAIQMPIMAAILEHPTHGIILFDGGYSSRIWEATKRFPERL